MQSETMCMCPKILRKDRQLKALGTTKNVGFDKCKSKLDVSDRILYWNTFPESPRPFSLSNKYFLIFIGIVSTTAVPTILENERIDSCRHL